MGSIKLKRATKRKRVVKSRLAKVIQRTIQADLFLRIEKSLIAIKVLSGSLASRRKKNWNHALEKALQNVRASQSRVSAVFNPLMYRLYPQFVDTIVGFIDEMTRACARVTLPSNLLNDIQLPQVQLEARDGTNESVQVEVPREEPAEQPNENEEKGLRRRFRSREYYLLLASIYLSESIEQMQMIFRNRSEIRTLANVIRHHITEVENKASEIYKSRVSRKHLPTRKPWTWALNLNVPSGVGSPNHHASTPRGKPLRMKIQ